MSAGESVSPDANARQNQTMNTQTISPVEDLLGRTLAFCTDCLGRDDYPGAWQALCRAIGLAPNRADILIHRGHLALFLKDAEAARCDFAAALKIAPDCASAYCGLARFHMLQGDLAEAEAAADRALALDPAHEDATQLRTEIQEEATVSRTDGSNRTKLGEIFAERGAYGANAGRDRGEVSALRGPPDTRIDQVKAARECETLRTECEWLAERLRRIDGEYRLGTMQNAHAKEQFFKSVPSDYYVEIITACNLRCPSCGQGHRKYFQRKPGRMGMEKFRAILAKIRTENPKARVSPYHQNEPFLHPELPEFVQAIKEHDFACEVSSNFNLIPRLDEFLLAGPDILCISVSGFTQEVYSRGHAGGDIEVVKRNMHLLRERLDALGVSVRVIVNYHMYCDNLGADFDSMKEMARALGFEWHRSWARSICSELTIPYLESRQGEGRASLKGLLARPAWLSTADSLPGGYLALVDRLVIRPEEGIEGQSGGEAFLTCPAGGTYLNVRVDGSVDLCGWGFDDRQEAFPDYLEMTPAQLKDCRTAGNAFCATCLRTNFCMRTSYADMAAMDQKVLTRFPGLPRDRLMLG